MLNWKYLFVSIAIVGIGFLGYLTYVDKLPGFLSGRFFLSQVTAIPEADLSYVQSVSGLAAVTSIEDLQQAFITTLLTNSNSFDKTDASAAEAFLKTYYTFPSPIPSSVSGALSASAEKFIQAQNIIPQTTTTTITPFLNEVLSILANHQVSTNNHQAVKRHQTTKSLLDSLIKQL